MQISDFLIADDVRFEVGGKVSIMGVYNEDITLQGVPALPIPLKLGFYVRVKLDDEEVPDEFSLDVILNSNSIAGIKGKIQQVGTRKGDYIAIPLPANLFPIEAPGKMEFVLQLYSHGQIVYKESRNLSLNIESAKGNPASEGTQ